MHDTRHHHLASSHRSDKFCVFELNMQYKFDDLCDREIYIQNQHKCTDYLYAGLRNGELQY